jgi:hypothetical protein
MLKCRYSFKAFTARVLQMNEYSKYLSCVKDEEGLPKMIKRVNVPFDDIMMCMIMLHIVPSALSTVYWDKMGVGNFPTSIKDVVNEFLLLEPEFRRNQLIQEVVKRQNTDKKATAFAKAGKHAATKGSASKTIGSYEIP